MRRFFLLVILIMSVSTAYAEIRGSEVSYQSGDTTLKGYLAFDDAVSGQRPGILVVHEWWGHNEYARQRARLLAGLGYTALAVDMYGDGKQADHPKDAGQFAGEVRKNMEVAEGRFQAAIALLKKHSSVSPEQISAFGYCFGGGIVLEMARRGVDMDVVASFHGSLGTPAPAKSGVIKAQLLVFNGAADPFVKTEQISQFKSEMDAAGVSYQFFNYQGAKHSFTNPGAT
ncbi:MAG: dienelactone hydrolase family protein, partial [Sedimenticola sp.]|nr:dienelactone hydrolase family protein [Sedimenticola sp.]